MGTGEGERKNIEHACRLINATFNANLLGGKVKNRQE